MLKSAHNSSMGLFRADDHKRPQTATSSLPTVDSSAAASATESQTLPPVATSGKRASGCNVRTGSGIESVSGPNHPSENSDRVHATVDSGRPVGYNTAGGQYISCW
jgi:hypothetical protein